MRIAESAEYREMSAVAHVFMSKLATAVESQGVEALVRQSLFAQDHPRTYQLIGLTATEAQGLEDRVRLARESLLSKYPDLRSSQPSAPTGDELVRRVDHLLELAHRYDSAADLAMPACQDGGPASGDIRTTCRAGAYLCIIGCGWMPNTASYVVCAAVCYCGFCDQPYC